MCPGRLEYADRELHQLQHHHLMKTDLSFPSENNVLRRAGRGCATSNQPKLNCARHRPSPAVASSKVSLWMQLLVWESTSCPDGARKSVSVAFWFWPTSVNHKLSLSLSLWLHVLDVVRVTRRGKQQLAESKSIFFPRYVSRRNHSTVQACCPSQPCERILSPTLPGLWQSPLDSRLTAGTMPVQSWAERVCWGLRKQPEMIHSVIHCKVKKNAWWSYGVRNREPMVNRGRTSQSICTWSVVFQSLYFSHIEPLWWGIHWKPCKPKRTSVKELMWYSALNAIYLLHTAACGR